MTCYTFTSTRLKLGKLANLGTFVLKANKKQHVVYIATILITYYMLQSIMLQSVMVISRTRPVPSNTLLNIYAYPVSLTMLRSNCDMVFRHFLNVPYDGIFHSC